MKIAAVCLVKNTTGRNMGKIITLREREQVQEISNSGIGGPQS